MAVNGFHDYGEELKQKWLFRQDLLGTRDATAEIGLYDDGVDAFEDATDVGGWTTEPGDSDGGTQGNYTRQTVNLDTTDITLGVDSNGDVTADFSVSFDTTDTTGTATGWVLVLSFQSDVVNAESGQNPHIIASAEFTEGSVNLGQQTSVNVNGTTTEA